MNPRTDEPIDPEIFRKSTNLGIKIAMIVTATMIRILSVNILIFLTIFESLSFLKNFKSSTISNAHSICTG